MVCGVCGVTSILYPTGDIADYSGTDDAVQNSNVFSYKRSNPGYTFTRKRFYKSVTHFKSHFKRYAGVSGIHIPQSVMDALDLKDLKNPMLYFEVKRQLKELKLPQYYRAIYEIIYRCGGDKPKLTSQFMEQCIHHYINLEMYFSKHRE